MNARTMCSTLPLSLNLLEVNRYLDDVAVANTKRERGDMKTSLQILLRNTSALEQVRAPTTGLPCRAPECRRPLLSL